MSGMVNWGIIGTGSVAELFAGDLKLLDGARLTGVGSRNNDTASLFAKRYNIPKHFASYDELLSSSDVDVVYVATPHIFHSENTINCIRHKKHVLCEKPMGMNEKEVRQIVEEAGKHNLFVMEAVWTFFLPFFHKLKDVLDNKIIGDVTGVSVECGFDARKSNKKRYFDLTLGGGILMDMGIYPVSMLSKLFCDPSKIISTAIFNEHGVDEDVEIKYQYDGFIAEIKCSLTRNLGNDFTINGTKGKIEVCGPWWHSSRILICSNKGRVDEIKVPYVGSGYSYEAQAVNESINNGRKECGVMTLSETLQNISRLDEIREQIRFL